MDLVKDLYGNGKLYRLSMDPSGIDISGETQVLRINSDKITGNLNIDGIVGIGKKPREKLDVNGNVRIFGADTPRYLDFYWNDANGLLDDTYGYAYPNGVRFFNNQDTDDTTDSDLNSYGIAGEILHYGGPGETYSNGFDFKTHYASSGNGWGSGPTSKMRILGIGNVGIGTTAPVKRLEIFNLESAGHVNDSTSAQLRLSSSDSHHADIKHGPIDGVGNFALQFFVRDNHEGNQESQTKDKPRMTIRANGNVTMHNNVGAKASASETIPLTVGAGSIYDPQIHIVDPHHGSKFTGIRLGGYATANTRDAWIHCDSGLHLNASTSFTADDIVTSYVYINDRNTGNIYLGGGGGDVSITNNLQVNGGGAITGGLSCGTFSAASATINDSTTINGNVGIGVAAGTSRLHVAGSTASNALQPIEQLGYDHVWRLSVHSQGSGYLGNGTTPIAIYTWSYWAFPITAYIGGWIYSPVGLIHGSDERIKTEITTVDDDKALNQVNSLECKEYHYKDPLRRNEHKTIGFNAQEVKDVIPNAVTLQTEWIPNELRTIESPSWCDNVLTISDLDMNPENVTGKCKFYVSNDISGNDEEVTEIECVMDEDGNKTNVFKFEKQYTNVFLHSKQMNDFHMIDKNQIFALHHSAIQELSRRNDAKTAKNVELERRCAEAEAKNVELQTKITSMEADMAIVKEKLGL